MEDFFGAIGLAAFIAFVIAFAIMSIVLGGSRAVLGDNYYCSVYDSKKDICIQYSLRQESNIK